MIYPLHVVASPVKRKISEVDDVVVVTNATTTSSTITAESQCEVVNGPSHTTATPPDSASGKIAAVC